MSLAVFWLLPLVPQVQAPQRVLAPVATHACSFDDIVAPSYSGAVDLASHAACNATSAGPWSGRLSPDGGEVFVTLAGPVGTFGQENCLVARVDADTDLVSASFSVGLFPEEIAWTNSGSAQLGAGFVTDSTSGTVTVFDADGQLVQTIALPDPLGFGSCFPFGITVSPDQRRAYVGTLDGSGNVYALDTALLEVVDAETLVVPGGHGRLAFHGQRLVVPSTEYDPGFTSSVARVVFVDPDDPAGAVAVTLPSAATFPSVQDVAVRCDGLVFVAGVFLGNEIHVLDARRRTYVGAIPSPTAGGLHQGLALSRAGLLALADYGSEEIAFYDAWAGVWLGLVDLTALPDAHSEPEELIFSKDGRKLWAVCNGSDSLAVFEAP